MGTLAAAVESPTMAATIIDGKQIAADVRAEVKVGVSELKEATGIVPGLATVLVLSGKYPDRDILSSLPDDQQPDLVLARADQLRRDLLP